MGDSLIKANNISDNNHLKQSNVLCIIGPSASGKTQLAMDLVEHFKQSDSALGVDLISVDSAMIYEHMDIGTAKPSQAELIKYPHALVDILKPEQVYSAADFCKDVTSLIEQSLNAHRLPVLVGGTMMYFKALVDGLSILPRQNPQVRKEISQLADQQGWGYIHAELTRIDPVAATKINLNDTQRVTRALEVYKLTGKPISYFWGLEKKNSSKWGYKFIALEADRKLLHSRIERRFDKMLKDGFLDEVKWLQQYKFNNQSLDLSCPSMKSVGYRQCWEYLHILSKNQSPKTINSKQQLLEFREKALAATRQLAKRQCTWIRSLGVKWSSDFKYFNIEPQVPTTEIIKYIESFL